MVERALEPTPRREGGGPKVVDESCEVNIKSIKLEQADESR